MVEEDETVVNHSALIQKDPFKQVDYELYVFQTVLNTTIKIKAKLFFSCVVHLLAGKSFGPFGFSDDALCINNCHCWTSGQNSKVSNIIIGSLCCPSWKGTVFICCMSDQIVRRFVL